MVRDSVKRRRTLVLRPFLLSVFYFFPIGPHLIHVFNLEISEDVRMAANQFIRDVAGNVFKVKGAAFTSELAMEDNLEDPDLVEPIYKQFRYDLCPECHKKFLRDPLGKEVAQKFDFSKN